MEVVEAVGGEDLDAGDPAKVAPVVAVWCPTNTCVVVAKNLASEEAWAVGKDDVVLGETFFSSRRRGDQ